MSGIYIALALWLVYSHWYKLFKMWFTYLFGMDVNTPNVVHSPCDICNFCNPMNSKLVTYSTKIRCPHLNNNSSSMHYSDSQNYSWNVHWSWLDSWYHRCKYPYHFSYLELWSQGMMIILQLTNLMQLTLWIDWTLTWMYHWIFWNSVKKECSYGRAKVCKKSFICGKSSRSSWMDKCAMCI